MGLETETEHEGPFATPRQLSTYLDKQQAAGDDSLLDIHTLATGRILARRMGGELAPEGLVLENTVVAYDFANGVDGFTGEALPQLALIPLPVSVVRGAFGDEFATCVDELYTILNYSRE